MRGQAVRMTPEVQYRFLKSLMEAQTLTEGDILCPVCGYRIQRVYSDETGHFSVKCPEHISINIPNLAYFARLNVERLVGS